MNKPVGDLKPDTEVTLAAGLALLRRPFPDHQISKLPKPTKAQTDAVKADFKAGVRCAVCGSWHHPQVVHLDYVGHAALTDRLLEADPEWSWEPCGFGPDGLPAFDRNGGLWIKLTVCGVTRLGYGNAEGKSGGDAVKEIIGDALRNAAMRFGAALDLWHKGDLHVAEDGGDGGAPEVGVEERATNLLKGCGSKELLKDAWDLNEKGWRAILDEPAYLRLKGLCIHLAKQFAAPPPALEPPTASEGFGFDPDDQIPF